MYQPLMQWTQGSDQLIRNVFCVGRNYAEHASELGNERPVEPVIFLKPVSAICFSGDTIRLPRLSQRVDHEVEIVVAMGEGNRIAGYGIGIDVTARDLQRKAQEKSLPWTISKGFDTFAPISAFVPAVAVENPSELSFSLKVNGIARQKGAVSEMIFSIPEIITYLSGIFTLTPGDLIFTGTPKGVASIESGDKLDAELSLPGGLIANLKVNAT